MNTIIEIDGLRICVEYEVEEAQKGGRTDPSWDASVSVIDYKVVDDDDNLALIQEQLEATLTDEIR